MMRRSLIREARRTALLLNQPAAVNTEFKMEQMVAQPRSNFSYKSSDKGEEVGARNEAAFMNYEFAHPKTLAHKLAAPNVINLLTILPVYCFGFFLASAAWGIFIWDIYSRKHYETVIVERPKRLQ